MPQFLRPFNPIEGATIKVANSVTASAVANLPESADVVAITNADTAAIVFFRCQPLDQTPTVAVADTDFPVLPNTQVRVSVPAGRKQFSVVASAATGNCYITPGIGN